MNLFDVLSAGKRDLNEENVSSFLAWILDPNQSHGCGNLFLSRLLSTMDGRPVRQWENELKRLSIDIVVEDEVTLSNSARRYIDIVIIMGSNKEGPSLPGGGNSLVFAIENKIRNSACKKEQLAEQFEGLKVCYQYSDFYFLYLTPNGNKHFKKAFNGLPDTITKSHLSWTPQSESPQETTITDIIRKVLEEESKALIDPIPNELKFILK
ncbi:MAG: PD-(D/E)XK nuclease family protein, partial [Desulfovibrionales bacterium]|nr:PD-(D/E)XK nuclease family protein [Desulfovibrionales bacterium]